MVTVSLVTRFGPKAQVSTQKDLNWDPSDSECNILTHYATLPISKQFNALSNLNLMEFQYYSKQMSNINCSEY